MTILTKAIEQCVLVVLFISLKRVLTFLFTLELYFVSIQIVHCSLLFYKVF